MALLRPAAPWRSQAAFAQPSVRCLYFPSKRAPTTNNNSNREKGMIRPIAATIILLLGLAFAAAPASAGSDDSAASASSATLAKFAWMWTDKSAATPPRQYLPAAACAMECCCQLFVDGSMKNQCRSRDDCINAGGICRTNTDPKCK
jgi:hypothetical protein